MLSAMRVLILGGGGMLGHKLCQLYRQRFDTWVTSASATANTPATIFSIPTDCLGGVDAAQFRQRRPGVAEVKPDAVINCIGIIKQLREAPRIR